MPAGSKKQRKQQKRRDRKRRELARQKRRQARAAATSQTQALRVDGPEPFNDSDEPEVWSEPDETGKSGRASSESGGSGSKLSEREDAALRLWWDKYMAADGPERLKMTREKLETVSADDEAYDCYFPESVYELEMKLPGEQYVAFLEELLERRPDVFSLSADWYTRSMVLEYLAQQRFDDVDGLLKRYAQELNKITDPFFSLMSAIRLSGRADAAQVLIEAAADRLEDSGLMYWAVQEVWDWIMFAHFQHAVATRADQESIDAIEAAASGLDLDDTEEARSFRYDFAIHLSGQSNKQWTKEELITGGKKAFRKIYLLCADYQHWLCAERGFEPIVADELRRLLVAALNGIDCPFNRMLMGLTRRDFEPYLARKLGFMSLDRIHAPATIVAMKHFYTFLDELGLVKTGNAQKSHSVCEDLWSALQEAVKDEWRQYRFLEQYFTA